MSDNKPGTQLTDEQAQSVGGGCSAEELQRIIDNLHQNYESLIEFTSYMIERVAK